MLRDFNDDGSENPEPKENVPVDVTAEEDLYVLDDFSGVTGEENASAASPESDEYVLAEESPEVGAALPQALEEVQLASTAGEFGGVEPPVEAQGDPLAYAAQQEVLPPLASEAGEFDSHESIRMFPRRPMLAAAAALLLGGGAFAVWKLVGSPRVTETTQIAGAPTATPHRSGGALVADGPHPKAGKFSPAQNSDPAPPPEAPAEPEPATKLAAAPTEPLAHEPVANVPEGSSPAPSTVAAAPELPVAPTLEVSEPPAAAPAGAAPVLASLSRGAEVVVRLRNGNLFNGKLDRFTPEEARLRLAKGTIEFQVRDVDVIVPLAQAPKKAGPQAVVSLRNGNRLAGRVTEDGAGHMTLLVGTAEITIPKNAVDSVEYRSPLGLVFDEGAAAPR